MKAIDYLLSQPLLITPELFETAVKVATRENAAPMAVQLRDGAPIDGARGMTRMGSTAVIQVIGPIFRYADMFTEMCGGATLDAVARDFCMARDDPAIDSIAFYIDSPGGEASGISEFAEVVHQATKAKPVVMYGAGQMCSALYWIGAAGSKVVCSDTAILGSIGVVMGFTKYMDGPSRKSYEFVSSQSPNKRPNPDTEKGRAEYQRIVDDMGAVFVEAVARYRDVSAETVLNDFGQGGVLVGRKAVEAGMADRVGSFESVLEELAAHGRPGVPGRAGASANGPAAEGKQMFGFLVRPKADGSTSIEPLASDPGQAQPQNVAVQAAAPPKPDPQVEAMRQELARVSAQLVSTRADGWYNALLAAGRIVPAEKADAVAAYTQAAIDDAVSPLADGKTRVSLVEGVFRARTPHTLTREQLGAGQVGAIVLPPGFQAMEANASQADAPPTDAELKAYKKILVDAGMLGREALAN